jgi:hypothetical protein
MLRDVKHDPLDKTGLASFISHHHSLIVNPHDMAITGQQTIFGVDGFAFLVTIIKFRQHTLPIVGVKLLKPELWIG